MCVACGATLGGYVDSASPEDVARAYARRDTLLHYDATHAQRTVVRDANDFIPSTLDNLKWLSKEEEAIEVLREAQERAAQASYSKGMRIAIDIGAAGGPNSRRVIDVNREEQERSEEHTSELQSR